MNQKNEKSPAQTTGSNERPQVSHLRWTARVTRPRLVGFDWAGIARSGSRR
jgi:hypothetical protein